MSPELLQAFFRLGLWIAGLSLCLVVSLPHDRAEWVVSVCSLMIGLALLGAVTLVSKATQR